MRHDYKGVTFRRYYNHYYSNYDEYSYFYSVTSIDCVTKQSAFSIWHNPTEQKSVFHSSDIDAWMLKWNQSHRMIFTDLNIP